MHTEHLQRVRPGVVMLSWFIAVAVASLIVTLVVATNLIDMGSGAGTRAAITAVAVGFFAGGLFAGLRTGEAPVLHGIAIGVVSLIVWVVVNVASSIAFPQFGWDALTPQLTVAVIVLQMAAAVLGARSGYRVRIGKPSL